MHKTIGVAGIRSSSSGKEEASELVTKREAKWQK